MCYIHSDFWGTIVCCLGEGSYTCKMDATLLTWILWLSSRTTFQASLNRRARRAPRLLRTYNTLHLPCSIPSYVHSPALFFTTTPNIPPQSFPSPSPSPFHPISFHPSPLRIINVQFYKLRAKERKGKGIPGVWVYFFQAGSGWMHCILQIALLCFRRLA